MNIKKCSKCGWEFPATFEGRQCKFCKGRLIGGYCACCGKWSEYLRPANNRCRECETQDHINWRNAHRNKAEERYQDWLKRIAAQLYPPQALTEDEWLEACKHFGGCGYCGSPDIDARSMFIPFKEGGRYTAWNIIPACEKCETARKTTSNPFKRMDDVYLRRPDQQATRLNQSLEKLQRIVDYLQTKMEEPNT